MRRFLEVSKPVERGFFKFNKRSKPMKPVIQAENKGLSFKGNPEGAKYVIDLFNEAFYSDGKDAPNFIRDFIFNIEVALQDAGYLDQDFNEVSP
jgi:hypothetical protein